MKITIKLYFLHATAWILLWQIDIHEWYSLVDINVAQIFICKDNQWIWHHNTSSTSCDVTDQTILFWSNSPRIYICDFVTHEIIGKSLQSWPKKLLFSISHTSFCIYNGCQWHRSYHSTVNMTWKDATERGHIMMIWNSKLDYNQQNMGK